MKTLAEIESRLECFSCSEVINRSLEINQVYASDLMSDILVRPVPGSMLVTGLASAQAIRTSRIAGIIAVVFVRGKKPTEDAANLAAKYGIPHLSTHLSMFETCGILFKEGLIGINAERRT